MKKIIVRADGHTAMGIGHIMRSSALIQILQQVFCCELWTKNPEHVPLADFQVPPTVHHFSIDDLREEANALVQEVAAKDTIVVLDGYHFSTPYQQVIKSAGIRLVCIDDIMQYRFLADMVINHAGGIAEKDYDALSYTRLLLGPSYALVKPLFYKGERPKRNLDEKKILVSLGGADPNNDTDRVLQRITRGNEFSAIHIVAGSANKNFDKLNASYGSLGNCFFHRNISGVEMYRLMQECGYAVLSPSTICYEYMSLGGVVYLYQIADNQERIRQYFLKEAMAFGFDDLGSVQKQQMAASIQKQQVVFDHKSPERLRQAFIELAKN